MIDLPAFDGLEFDPGPHKYTLNGFEIPSVSDIIEPLNREKYKGIDERTLSNAADKGTAVHNAIENWISFGIEDIEAEHKGYFEGFLKWWDKTKPVVVATELRCYHRILRYGGTLDLLCLIDDELTLVDYKTTAAVYDTFRIQLSGYENALSSFDIKVKKKEILLSS